MKLRLCCGCLSESIIKKLRLCLCVQEGRGSLSNVFFELFSRDVTTLTTTAYSKNKYSNTALQ